MAGAIAGTTILSTEANDQLQAITATVNNDCNLACQKCYLAYAGRSGFMDDETKDAIIASSASLVAIVGKEPLVHANETAVFIDALYAAGKRVSMITNGLWLDRFPDAAIEKLDYLDVSMDGGPQTYRFGYDALLRRLDRFPKKNVLHVLHQGTIDKIDDMLAVPFDKVMFSPLLETGMQKGIYRVPLAQVLDAVVGSTIRDTSAIVNIDVYHVAQDELSFPELKERVRALGLEDHMVLTDVDPLHHGIVRVTYDGLFLSPQQSLFPKEYQKVGVPVGDIDAQYRMVVGR